MAKGVCASQKEGVPLSELLEGPWDRLGEGSVAALTPVHPPATPPHTVCPFILPSIPPIQALAWPPLHTGKTP